MPTRNIGGSLLPSNNPRILQPLKCPAGTLQVVPCPELDAHALTLTKGERQILIASHPNGFSCYALALNMADGNEPGTREQAEYIVRCGGTAMNSERIIDLIQP